jgi:hypothetical protein
MILVILHCTDYLYNNNIRNVKNTNKGAQLKPFKTKAILTLTQYAEVHTGKFGNNKNTNFSKV